MDTAQIERSLELAAEREHELRARVYARLFGQFPELEPLFVRDTAGLVRAEMLARTFDTILDYIGEQHYAIGLIQSEIVTHEGYGVPPDVFVKFFDAVADTLPELLGDAWTPAMADSWQNLVRELQATAEANIAA